LQPGAREIGAQPQRVVEHPPGHLARDLDLRVVAEGVADAETALALSTLRCERIKGEYVSPPLAPQEIVNFAAGLAGLSLRPGT